MKINDTIYCISQKDEKVYKATLIGTDVGGLGYSLYQILNYKNEAATQEAKLCYKTKPEAEAYLKEVLPYIQEAKNLQVEAQAKIDDLRIKIIGYPQFEDLANRIKGDKHG